MTTPAHALARTLATRTTETGAAWPETATADLRADVLAVRLEAIERALYDLAAGCMEHHPRPARMLTRQIGALAHVRDDLHRLARRDARRR